MLWLLLLTLASGADENLLRNPGFEQVAADIPEHWNLFVMEYPNLKTPEDEPLGRLDTIAREGARAALLHNPVPYRNEPCNNWSQILWGRFGGERLRVAGVVKTENATAAAIWLQCWQRSPYKLLHVASTSDQSPMSGTTDWTPLEMTVDVPPETDFVMLRCVLRGKGKAWFDSLSVAKLPAPIPPPKPEKTITPAVPVPASKTPDIKGLNEMTESMRSFSKTNQELLTQVESLQQEIQALRDQLTALQQAAAATGASGAQEVQPPPERPIVQPPATPQKRVPPLLPHGLKPEDFP